MYKRAIAEGFISQVRAGSEVQTRAGKATAWTLRRSSLNPELQCAAGPGRASLAHEDYMFARGFSSSLLANFLLFRHS